jgi:hypothetical protein
VALWFAFVLRGSYYCVQLPMWEGLDEWAHFAALQYFAGHGHMPARTDLVSDEVVRSLELAPLPWSNNGWVAGAVNHDRFWQLPVEEISRRQAELAQLTAAYRRPADLPPALQRQYEGQQPPLYYAVMTLPYLLSRGWPLPAQVLWLRVLGLLLASATIPLTYAIARRIPAARGAALAVTAFVATMPAVVLLAAHIGSDSLAMALVTLALWTLVRAGTHWPVAGLALGAAMLTKGYAIVLIPVFVVAALRNRRMVPGLGLALAIAGWWYAANLASTGTLAGDQMDVASHARLADKVAAITKVDWRKAIDSAALTHIWIGGWSFLQLRSWMYRVFEVLALLAVVGLARQWRSLGASTRLLIAAQGLFILATAYFSVNVFLAMHFSAGVGWYMVAMSAAEATLLAAGIAGLLGLRRARVAMAGIAFLALALDVYSLHFLLAPYYHGLVRHRAEGSLEAFHFTDFRQYAWSLGAAWPIYLAGALLTLWSFRSLLPTPARPRSRGSAAR